MDIVGEMEGGDCLGQGGGDSGYDGGVGTDQVKEMEMEIEGMIEGEKWWKDMLCVSLIGDRAVQNGVDE